MQVEVDTLGVELAEEADEILKRSAQPVDAPCGAGRAMFQMMGVFAEFERAMMQERVKAGLARARAQGKTLGRPRGGSGGRGRCAGR